MEQNASDSLFELQVSYSSGNNFRESSKWANFIAIIIFVALGLALLGLSVSATFLLGTAGSGNGGYISGMLGIVIIPIIILGMVAYLVANIQLLRFALRMKRAIDRQDQELFNSSLKAFKNFFLLTGILSILSLLYSTGILMFSLFGMTATSLF